MNEHRILKSPVEGVNMQAQRAHDTLLRCRLSSFLMDSLGLFYVMIFIIRLHTTVHKLESVNTSMLFFTFRFILICGEILSGVKRSLDHSHEVPWAKQFYIHYLTRRGEPFT